MEQTSIMTPEEFCLWLQGFMEVTGTSYSPTQTEWNRIKTKLDSVVKRPIPSAYFPTLKPGEVYVLPDYTVSAK